MEYNTETIRHLTKLILGDDASRIWLQKNNFPELIMLHFALKDNTKVLQELANKKHVELVFFAQAALDNKSAFNWLAKNKKFIWAATVRVVYKDKGAEAWLLRNHLSHFAELGKAILKNKEEDDSSDILGIFKKIIKPFK